MNSPTTRVALWLLRQRFPAPTVDAVENAIRGRSEIDRAEEALRESEDHLATAIAIATARVQNILHAPNDANHARPWSD